MGGVSLAVVFLAAARRRRAAAILTLTVAAGLLVGCTSAPEQEPDDPDAPVWESDYVEPDPVAIAPLSGVVAEASALQHPSIAAKIDNHPAARPQQGLESTDIVFEELVEGGLTRYVAVWHSSIPELLGPVRSIRPMDPDIISPLGGIVAYSGGQERFVQLMRDTPVYNAIHGQPDTADTFFRTNTKSAPHNVLVRAQQVVGQHSDLAAPQQHFAFAADTASATATREGAPITGISLVFGQLGTPTWAWDAAAGVWLRSMTGGAADVDAAGAQLNAENIVIVRVPVTMGLGVPKTELIGSGEAWVATGGGIVHATWSKATATDPIRLVDDAGVTVRLAPGNTWVELVPTTGSVSFG